ncbi:MAG: hypothetical protein FD123_954 [Bacteroidetes bacterium]|nr:MAG: hypothetical protein FD123_954 [Bacteroidota bacterium]
MTRFLFISTLLLATCFAVHGQTGKKIRMEKEYSFKIRDGKQDSTGTLKTTRQYDTNGKPVLEINYCKYPWDCEPQHPDSFKSRYEFRYDDKGHLVERKYYTNGQLLPWSTTKYSYKTNDTGKVIEQTIENTQTYDQGKETYYDKDVEQYFFDGKGKLIKEISTSVYTDYSFDFVTTYKYDKAGNLTEVRFGKNKKLYTYDSKGNCIKYEMKGMHTCAADIVKWKKKFDDKGNLVGQTTYNARSQSWTDRHVYNEKNQRIQTLIARKKGTDILDEEFFYNGNGDIILIKQYDQEKLSGLTKFEYEYY